MAATLQFVTGDATAPIGTDTRMIAHVCNDQGAWGAGFVLAISKRWKEPEQDYRARTRWPLGSVQAYNVGFHTGESLYVLNMIAQRGFPSRQRPCAVDFDALAQCLHTVKAMVTGLHPLASVHMPRIGCGIAGATWDEIEPLVQRALVDAGVSVTVYDLPARAS